MQADALHAGGRRTCKVRAAGPYPKPICDPLLLYWFPRNELRVSSARIGGTAAVDWRFSESASLREVSENPSRRRSEAFNHAEGTG